MGQWIGIHLPMQGTRVRSLIWEDPTCRGATKPVQPQPPRSHPGDTQLTGCDTQLLTVTRKSSHSCFRFKFHTSFSQFISSHPHQPMSSILSLTSLESIACNHSLAYILNSPTFLLLVKTLPYLSITLGFPHGSVSKESVCSAGELG